VELICERSNGDVKAMRKNPGEFEMQRLKSKKKIKKKTKKYLFQKSEGSVV
jgi:hypothetical protein